MAGPVFPVKEVGLCFDQSQVREMGMWGEGYMYMPIPAIFGIYGIIPFSPQYTYLPTQSIGFSSFFSSSFVLVALYKSFLFLYLYINLLTYLAGPSLLSSQVHSVLPRSIIFPNSPSVSSLLGGSRNDVVSPHPPPD